MFDLLKKLEMINRFPGMFGIQRCFFADEGKGGGDGNSGDSGDGGSGEGNKGDGDGKKDDDDAGKKPEEYEVTIGGEKKLLSIDELKEHASKSAGADKLMREASDLRKGAKSGLDIKEAFDSVLKSDDVDAEDVRRLATLMNIDPNEMEKMFNEELEKIGVKGKGEKKDAGDGKKIGREQLNDEMKDILDQAKNEQIVKAEADILDLCKKSVDKDDFFGKIIEDTPDEQREDRKDVIVKMVHRDIRGKILASPYTGEKFGAEMIQNSIQTIRSELKKYGIPSKSSKQSAISNVLAALGPTGGLPAEVQSDEKIERVSSTESGYDDNVVKRLGQKLVQSIFEGKK